MDNSIYRENVKIRYSEMDFDLVLKPSVLLQFLQDLASDNAEALGFGYSFNVKYNLAWFLLKYHIEFSNYPKGLYNLEITTNPRGYSKLFAYRDFEILYDNKTIGRAATTWGLVDFNTRKMVNVADAIPNNPYFREFEKKENDLKYNKILPLSKIDFEKTYEIRFDDLDVNGHVNNSNYIVWAFEPLEFDFRKNKKIKTLDMVFKKEIQYGSRVLSQVEVAGNFTKHILKNAETNEDLCLVSVSWIDKTIWKRIEKVWIIPVKIKREEIIKFKINVAVSFWWIWRTVCHICNIFFNCLR